MKTKKEKKNIYKKKTGGKKSPKISRLKLGFLALILKRTLTRTLTHMTSERQLPVTATFWVLRPNECNSELKNGIDRFKWQRSFWEMATTVYEREISFTALSAQNTISQSAWPGDRVIFRTCRKPNISRLRRQGAVRANPWSWPMT